MSLFLTQTCGKVLLRTFDAIFLEKDFLLRTPLSGTFFADNFFVCTIFADTFGPIEMNRLDCNSTLKAVDNNSVSLSPPSTHKHSLYDSHIFSLLFTYTCFLSLSLLSKYLSIFPPSLTYQLSPSLYFLLTILLSSFSLSLFHRKRFRNFFSFPSSSGVVERLQ